MKVSLSIVHLREADGDPEALAEFLKKKLPKDCKVSGGEPIEIEGPDQLKADHIRLLAKKFLASQRLYNDLRVVNVGEMLAIKNRRRKRFTAPAT